MGSQVLIVLIFVPLPLPFLLRDTLCQILGNDFLGFVHVLASSAIKC